MTSTEHAASIRATLKAHGISSRDVSVKTDYYSMGSSIRITIKNPAVSSLLVETIANPHERIDRDGFGEILSGGNRFVFVSYSLDAQKALAAPYVAKVDAALAQADDNSLVPVEGFAHCLVGRGRCGYGLSLWGADGHIGEFNDAETAAARIGQMLVNS